jgi:hypothetical protein
MHVLVLGNFDVQPTSGSARFTHPGWWYEYWTGDSTYVENINQVLTFEPGDYRLYTDVRLENPDISTGLDKKYLRSETSSFKLHIYPNPVSNKIHLGSAGVLSGKVLISLHDISGRKIYEKKIPSWLPGHTEVIDSSVLGKGIYIVRMESGGGVGVGKVVK